MKRNEINFFYNDTHPNPTKQSSTLEMFQDKFLFAELMCDLCEAEHCAEEVINDGGKYWIAINQIMSTACFESTSSCSPRPLNF